MIDIHAHILPFIDDGAQNEEQSLQMCEEAADNGITAIIATPHLYSYSKVSEISEKRDKEIAKLKEQLVENKCRVSIYPGFEVYCGEDVLEVTDFSELTLNESRYMLCEFDFNEPDSIVFMRYIDHIISHNIIPVIAHPERYTAFLNDYESLNDIIRWGTLFQLNADSLTGFYGAREKRLAVAMLQCGFCDFLATDAHSPTYRSPRLMEHIINSQIDFDEEEIEKLTVKNPQTLLDDGDFAEIKRGYITYEALI